ncbi:macrolide family glycosyltransferase [Streptomyces jeddahensis]|uniref:Oleandomycin glycosyltransferase n=1 Tax=Streptomyces jeddahensis TaxID=1716141 RepID=A0A177HL82_9ACTN|nr:macrolide family glycosyltransferase [Streptomyces jeddahensis]OAH11439.1 oleandomycin glycosyltransferase [Streptomyces jeddahensis]
MTRLRPAHIAMVGVPAISHVLPSLDIIRELVARGHRVTYADDFDAPRIADAILPTGAEPVRFRSTLPVGPDASWPDDPIAAMTLFRDDAIGALEQIAPFYEQHPADLYLYDIGGYAARVLAERQSRPLVQLSPTFTGWEPGPEAPDVLDGIRALPGADAYEAGFRDWLVREGATTTDPWQFSGVPPRCVATVPRAMQPFADHVDDKRITFTGPCLAGREREERWERPAAAAGKKLLLVSLGSAYTDRPEFYRSCLAAFGPLSDWYVVLQIGTHVDAAALGPLPENVEVHRWVPQLAVLRKADAFVTHAGMGGSAEGLYCGVPMIAVPQDVDQFANADRLVELGVARRVDTADATPEALRAALLALTGDRDVAARTADLRAQARAEGGTARAVELIEAELPDAR